MKLAPLGDKVVLKQLEAQETTKSGLLLTSQSKEKPQEAIVVAVGPGVRPYHGWRYKRRNGSQRRGSRCIFQIWRNGSKI